MKTALTIAGSDSSGGAGIQADIKTMTAHGVYAMSAVTALTAQNTAGVTGIFEVSPGFLELQLDSVFSDIWPDAVKIGMVSSGPLILSIVKKLKQYHARNIVVDPVMVSTSGSRLLSADAVSVLKSELAPLADLLTPNIPEGEVLSGMKITDHLTMEQAAELISRTLGCSVLLKGGHSAGCADDLLCTGSRRIWFCGKRVSTKNTHGTGCTLSSAIASNLAQGLDMEQSVRRAKDYVSGALAAGLELGHGSGPLNHLFDLHSRFIQNSFSQTE